MDILTIRNVFKSVMKRFEEIFEMFFEMNMYYLGYYYAMIRTDNHSSVIRNRLVWHFGECSLHGLLNRDLSDHSTFSYIEKKPCKKLIKNYWNIIYLYNIKRISNLVYSLLTQNFKFVLEELSSFQHSTAWITNRLDNNYRLDNGKIDRMICFLTVHLFVWFP